MCVYVYVYMCIYTNIHTHIVADGDLMILGMY